jgi:hypothetical protein
MIWLVDRIMRYASAPLKRMSENAIPKSAHIPLAVGPSASSNVPCTSQRPRKTPTLCSNPDPVPRLKRPSGEGGNWHPGQDRGHR